MKGFTLDKLPPEVLAGEDVEEAFIISRFVVAAERLQIFRKLHGKELTAAELGKRTGIVPVHRESFLDVLVALGLLKKKNNRYRNSAKAEKYFIRERSQIWTRLYSGELVKYYDALSALEGMLTTGKDYREVLGVERKTDYELLRDDPQWASDFAELLHIVHQPDASALARTLDLSGFHSLLDVGGCSGVMSMALVRANPGLKATVFDFEPVCRAAKKIIRREGLGRRMKTHVGDMFKKIPTGHDVVMFWDIGPLEQKTLALTYQSLPTRGMLVVGGIYRSAHRKRSLKSLTRQFITHMPRPTQTRQQ